MKLTLRLIVLFAATLPYGPVAWPQGPRPKAVANSISMQLALLPAGKFRMGQNEEAVDVTLSVPFMIGQTEVTQGQWKRVMATEPWRKAKRYFKEGEKYPVTFVSWEEAKAFCEKLTAIEQKAGGNLKGIVYGLPTEAQWEYACRAGSTATFSCGDAPACLNECAWWGGLFGDGNAGAEPYPHEVATKKPNVWGLFDMHGNVCEWCNDVKAWPLKGGTDPVGPQEGSTRVVRGGAWYSHPAMCSCGYRDAYPASNADPVDGNIAIGFRVVGTMP